MDYLELSIRKLEEECKSWVQEIKKDYQPDIIIYVAKAGFLIGKVFAKEFGNIPLIAIGAERKGNSLKTKLQPALKLIPYRFRNFVIRLELKTNIHKTQKERNVHFLSDIKPFHNFNKYKILLVDDSVDTGHSIKQVKEKVCEVFHNSEVRTAALNVWDKSKEIVQVEYALYKNVIIKAPMSKDSKEYEKFVKLFNNSLLNN